jgi:hypothetical protein
LKRSSNGEKEGRPSGRLSFAGLAGSADGRNREISKNSTLCPEPDIAEILSSDSARGAHRLTGSGDAGGAQVFEHENTPSLEEALMVGMRSDRARARARDLLATVYPIPEDVEFRRLRELALDYVKEAERLETENRGRTAEPDELISAALDTVARDYFARALFRAVSDRKHSRDGGSEGA